MKETIFWVITLVFSCMKCCMYILESQFMAYCRQASYNSCRHKIEVLVSFSDRFIMSVDC